MSRNIVPSSNESLDKGELAKIIKQLIIEALKVCHPNNVNGQKDNIVSAFNNCANIFTFLKNKSPEDEIELKVYLKDFLKPQDDNDMIRFVSSNRGQDSKFLSKSFKKSELLSFSGSDILIKLADFYGNKELVDKLEAHFNGQNKNDQTRASTVSRSTGGQLVENMGNKQSFSEDYQNLTGNDWYGLFNEIKDNEFNNTFLGGNIMKMNGADMLMYGFANKDGFEKGSDGLFRPKKSCIKKFEKGYSTLMTQIARYNQFGISKGYYSQSGFLVFFNGKDVYLCASSTDKIELLKSNGFEETGLPVPFTAGESIILGGAQIYGDNESGNLLPDSRSKLDSNNSYEGVNYYGTNTRRIGR